MSVSVLQHTQKEDLTGTTFASFSGTAFSSNTGTGSTLVMAGSWGGNGSTENDPTLSDNQVGDSWTGRQYTYDAGHTEGIYGGNCTNATSGVKPTPTVTATGGDSLSFVSVYFMELAGCATSNSYDTGGTAEITAGTSLAITTSGNLAVDNEGVITFASDLSGSPTLTVPATYTPLDTGTLPDANAFKLLGAGTSGATLTATWTVGAGVAATAGLVMTFKPAGGATVYSLSMTAGSYAVTGDALSIPVARMLALTAGSYALTGDATTVRVARRLALTAGWYTLTGDALTGRVARQLALTAGSYTLTGDALTGRVARLLSLAAGAYAISGASATLTYTPGGGGGVAYSLALSPGSYALTGDALTGAVGYVFVTAAGVYLITGDPAELIYLPPSEGGTGGPPPTARRKYVLDVPPLAARAEPDSRPAQRPRRPGEPATTDAPEPVLVPGRPAAPAEIVVVPGFVLEPGTTVDVRGADGRPLQGMTAQRLKAARQRQMDADVLAELGELIYLLNLL